MFPIHQEGLLNLLFQDIHPVIRTVAQIAVCLTANVSTKAIWGNLLEMLMRNEEASVSDQFVVKLWKADYDS